jgi:hypothetical protein
MGNEPTKIAELPLHPSSVMIMTTVYPALCQAGYDTFIFNGIITFITEVQGTYR